MVWHLDVSCIFPISVGSFIGGSAHLFVYIKMGPHLLVGFTKIRRWRRKLSKKRSNSNNYSGQPSTNATRAFSSFWNHCSSNHYSKIKLSSRLDLMKIEEPKLRPFGRPACIAKIDLLKVFRRKFDSFSNRIGLTSRSKEICIRSELAHWMPDLVQSCKNLFSFNSDSFSVVLCPLPALIS